MKKNVKIILGCIAVLASLAVAVFFYFKPLSVEAVRIQPKEALLYLTERGFIESDRDLYIVASEVSGKVLRTYVTKDSTVFAGDLLLDLDATNLESERLAHQALIQSYEAQIALARQTEVQQKEEYRTTISRLNEELLSVEGQRQSTEARRAEAPSLDEQLALLDISIAQEELQISFAANRLEEAQKLFEFGVIAAIEIENQQLEMAIMQQGLALLQEQREARLIDQSKAAKEEIKITLTAEGDRIYYDALSRSVAAQIYAFEDKLNTDTSQYTVAYYNALIQSEYAALSTLNSSKYRLTSPVSGVIQDFPAQNQSLLSAFSIAATIQPNDGALKASAYVSTRDIDSLSVGQKVQLVRKLRDQDILIPGTISEIASSAEIRVSALGIEERRVKVSVLPDANHAAAHDLKDGYDVDIRFILVNQPNKFLVPGSAVFTHNGIDSVFIVAGGVARLTTVNTGIKTSSEIVLEEGVNSDDVVILDPNIAGLKDGTRVDVTLR